MKHRVSTLLLALAAASPAASAQQSDLQLSQTQLLAARSSRSPAVSATCSPRWG